MTTKRKPGIRCSVCNALTPELLEEMAAGHAIGIGPGPMSSWLEVEHGIAVGSGAIQNHLRGKHFVPS